MTPDHAEFRDDRFVASFNLFNTPRENSGGENSNGGGAANSTSAAAGAMRTATAAYIVRAVTPGKFVHPAATVEDMYRPDLYARTAAGTLTITAKE